MRVEVVCLNTIDFAAAVSVSPGKVRTNNEDNFYFNGIHLNEENRDQSQTLSETPKGALYVYGVFDGMGGEALGEDASLLAAETTKAYHEEGLKHGVTVEKMFAKITTDANAKICKRIMKSGEKRIGTTLAMLCVAEDKARISNVGDSRVYLYRAGKLTQISVDDTVAQRLLNLNIITKEQAQTHSDRHKLTQHLGIFTDEMAISPHISTEILVEKGDKFLLCSDGLTDMLSDEDIEETMKSNVSPKELTEKLVQHALDNGGHDNVTAMVIIANSRAKRRPAKQVDAIQSNGAKKRSGTAGKTQWALLLPLCMMTVAVVILGATLLMSRDGNDKNPTETADSPVAVERLEWSMEINGELMVGDVGTLMVSRVPANAGGRITYKSSDLSVVFVNEMTGDYKVCATGAVVVSAMSGDKQVSRNVMVIGAEKTTEVPATEPEDMGELTASTEPTSEPTTTRVENTSRPTNMPSETNNPTIAPGSTSKPAPRPSPETTESAMSSPSPSPESIKDLVSSPDSSSEPTEQQVSSPEPTIETVTEENTGTPTTANTSETEES